MKFKFKNFGLLELIVTLSGVYVISMLIWTASTRLAVETKANLVRREAFSLGPKKKMPCIRKSANWVTLIKTKLQIIKLIMLVL